MFLSQRRLEALPVVRQHTRLRYYAGIMPSERVKRRIDRLLDEADEAVGARNWALVRELCDAVLRLDPENEDARTFLEAASRDTGVSAIAGPAVPAATSAEAQPPAKPAVPTSFASGRYKVKRFLGEGGKKRVFLAHDETLDRDVAFALIKTAGLDDVGRERVRREAQAMGRMGTHPCIMPIYDLGEEDGQPFMVQPLMGGGDVEGLIEKANGPLELERAIQIATQTAQGLSFAHSKGIVHRDLKPGNVWLDTEGAAKIGDFGLAVATDRSRLTVEKVMVGTVNYMPPEQATGGEITPRADLYSLGAMMYQMCTGRVPFMAEDDIGVISQHINTPPVAPGWHNQKIPRALDSLILRLMAKDPGERPETADEVLKALRSIDISPEAQSEKREASLDSMAGGVFVGRQREMDQLKAIFEEVLSGKGRMVTLVGEPGIGKTRTAQELATYAGMRGGQVLWGRCYESGGAPPYWPWVQAIRDHVAATEPQALRGQLASNAPVIAEMVSDVREKLPDLPAPAAISDPEAARFRLFDSVVTFLKSLSRTRPQVVMLEDLHWADRPSLRLLEFAARELANSKILIVGNYRDVELSRRHPLSVTLGDLTRERLFERVVLRGLQKHDVARFIEIAAGITPPQALVDAVHTQTEGNPLFVTETVRLLIQEGNITSGQQSKGGRTSWEIRVPEGVKEVIGRRLDRLSERCNVVLTMAAVIGRQFRFDLLKRLVDDTSEAQLLDAMDEARAARIVEELPSEVGLYQFTHAQMQETLTSEISSNRIVRMHARIAEALEAHYGEDAGAHAAELAEHFALAEVVLGAERACKYLLLAGKAALDALAYEDAAQRFERVVSLVPAGTDDKTRIEGLIGLARALDSMAQEGSPERLKEAVELLVGIGDTARAVSTALSIFPMGRDVERGIYEAVGNLAAPGSAEAVDLLARTARTYMGTDFQAASTKITEALTQAKRLGDDRLRARCAASAASIFGMAGQWQETLAPSLEAVELGASAGAMDSVWLGHIWASNTYSATGKPDLADRHSHEALRASEEVKNRSWEVSAIGGLARTELFRGNWSRSREHCTRGLGMDPADSRLICVTNAIARATGDFSSIRTAAEGILHVWAPHDDAQVALATGDAARAAQARKEFDKVFPGGRKDANGWSAANHAWALLSVLERDVAAATDQLKSFSHWKGWISHLGMSSDRILGLLALTAGQQDLAVEHFRRGLELCRKAGYRPENGWLCCNLSECLLELDGPGDREEAVQLQDEAIKIARELGMKPLLERLLSKRQILKA